MNGRNEVSRKRVSVGSSLGKGGVSSLWFDGVICYLLPACLQETCFEE